MDISVRAANPDKPCSLALSTGYAKDTQAKLLSVIPYCSQMLSAQSILYISQSKRCGGHSTGSIPSYSQSSIASLTEKEIPKSISTKSPTLTMLSDRPRIRSNDASRTALA